MEKCSEEFAGRKNGSSNQISTYPEICSSGNAVNINIDTQMYEILFQKADRNARQVCRPHYRRGRCETFTRTHFRVSGKHIKVRYLLRNFLTRKKNEK
ncbi:hypothetical protein NPIL_624521 [Nephila pilipes]|uniref:Uncharacterized protein n=1 Tax=Nephila pilipes TaxID=299642 RepID=A0A8X6N994_NEPPI|nr:hypothetical protein NPIL_624521 [Nephila pilipes]